MKNVKVKNMKVGEKYFFVDTDFRYHDVKMPTISEERINKIIDGEFSTRNEGDRYEVIRHLAFKTEKEAKQYSLKMLKEYKKWQVNCLNMLIDLLKEDLLDK